jgi:hypothetical protein
MPFEVEDLMMDVFPERAPWQMQPCEQTSPPRPPPPPCEAPTMNPKCKPHTCKPHSAQAFAEGEVQLPPLAALREQLQQALHP